MRTLSLWLMVFLAVACTPGTPEFGACQTTPDCQVLLQCRAVDGALLVNDAGYTYADAGVCRRTCQTSVDCEPTSEVCGGNLLCSSDGGY